MITTIPFDPDRFRSSARHYFARANYAPRLIRKVVAELALAASDRVMDLGCGPGPLAIAFAPFVGEVIAIDPAKEMLAAGREAAAELPDGASVRFVLGSSNALGDQFGRFRLVAMGRSFHWMDRADTLIRLDRIVEPHGAVAIFGAETIRQGAGHWSTRFDEILKRYAANEPEWRSPDWRRHETFLLDSPFSVIDGMSIIEQVSFPAARLADRAFSMSRTSPDALGPDKAAALAADMQALAADTTVDGILSEIVESSVLIARRP
jgi:SAM-dependent methyltransferase